MRVWAGDFETHLFRSGRMAPEPVCMTWAEGSDSGIVHHTEARALLLSRLLDPEVRIVGQFVAFDFGVAAAAWPDLVPAIFAAYDDDRVVDTKVREQMRDIARGTYRGKMATDGTWIKFAYGLEDLARRLLGVQLKKDGWRMRYGAFIDVPLSGWVDHAKEIQRDSAARLDAFAATGRTEASLSKEGKAWIKELQAIVTDYPEQVLRYPIDDAINTLAVYEVQERTTPPEIFVDQFRQVRGDFALHLSSVHGMRTDGAGVYRLRVNTEAALVDVTARLQAAGFVRPDGSRDTKRVSAYMVEVCTREGLLLRKTEGGAPCLDVDACEATEDELLQDYADYTGLKKTLDTDIKMLETGTKYPVHCRYGLAESGRTTCSAPNIQNLRKLPGIRECFVPRPGKVFIQGDYPQLELYTLAQCCYSWFGASTLGEMLKRGMDPHTAFAAKLAGCSYEEGVRRNKAKATPDEVYFAKVLRPVAKPWNFGKPGGLGDKKMVALAASDAYGHVEITLEQAKEYSRVWLATFPEMKEYFARVNFALKNPAKLATVVLPMTGFVRGGAMYCAAANTGFQGLGAACAKNALWQVAREQYARPASVLYGSRTVWFVHDEIAAEASEETCHDSAHELVRIMRVGANEFLPDVPYTEEKMADVPTVMRMWSKDAVQVFDARGRLIPWEGKKAA